MSHFINSSLFSSVSALLLATVASAQTPPDAGALQQQIERERQGVLPQRMAPERPAVSKDMKSVSGLNVEVKEFRFSGNTLLSTAQLASAVSEYINRSLDFAKLQAAAAAVAEVYRTAGWVVNAYLPDQDVQAGVVTIRIIEAVFGGTRIEGQSSRITADRLLQGINAQQSIGAPLNADALDRALLLADDLPGVSVSGALRAGQREGETELVYRISDESLVLGDVRADNTGARSTGSKRLSANLNFNSPVGIGDKAVINAMASEGSQYTHLGYTVPLGRDGWQIGASVSNLVYRLLNADGKGTSQTTGLDARYPLIRTRLQNLFVSVSVDHKNFDNHFNGAVTTQYGVNTSSVGLAGNLFDNLGGGGANSASLIMSSGHRHNHVGTTDSNFTKLRYTASRQQAITPDLSLYANLDGQHTKDILDTSESFYLGGANGVRAYPSNEGRGSSGEMGKLELRWRLPEGWIFSGFYDHGRVRNRDGSPNYSLSGIGLAVMWQAQDGLLLTTTLAHRLGSNPSPNAAGNDQDGTLTKSRIWISATLNF